MRDLDPQVQKMARVIAAEVIAQIHASRPPVAPEWLNMAQAAAHLGYTTEKAFRDRCSKPNPPPSYKLGRLRRFKRHELDEWVRNGG